MLAYSTCRSCNEKLIVTAFSQYWHDTCPAKPTRMEQLLNDFLVAAQMGDQPELEAQLEAEIHELQARPPQLRAAAVQYAQWGWPVFPLAAGSKQPAIPKRLGGRGVLDATTDVTRVHNWWSAHPSDNIGIATGFAFDVLDIDIPDGITSWPQLEPRVPDIHGRVSTASGGFHLYLPPSGNGNRARMMPGVDYRGQGGYVVAPPSVLTDETGPGSCGSWSWAIYPSPDIKPALKAVVSQ